MNMALWHLVFLSPNLHLSSLVVAYINSSRHSSQSSCFSCFLRHHNSIMCRTVVFSHAILLIAEYGPFWWLIFKFLDNDTRIAYSDAVGRNVFHDHTSCSDGTTFTNCHSGKNCHIAAYPAVSAYGHRLGPFLPRVAFLRVRAVAGRIDADIRTDEYIVADCNWSLVKDDEIEVGKEPPADLDMLPVVAMEWRVYECVVIGLSQDLLQFLIP